jgi:hypothetical protein
MFGDVEFKATDDMYVSRKKYNLWIKILFLYVKIK